MWRVDLAPWISILKAVDSVKTPIGLGALALLILFFLYRMIFARLRLEKVTSREVAKIVSKAMTLLFWIAITGLVISILSYVILTIFDPSEKNVSENIRQLRPGDSPVAIGAVQALSRFTDKTRSYDESICGALSAFVRDNPKPSEPVFVRDIAPEIQKAMELLSKLNGSSRCPELDLRGTNLARLNLPGGNLIKADLSGAILDEANLVRADLSQSDMAGTSLIEANLRHAIVKGATLTSANLRGADLSCAQLDGAKGLDDDDLTSTRLDGASLKGLNLRWTRVPRFPNNSNCSD